MGVASDVLAAVESTDRKKIFYIGAKYDFLRNGIASCRLARELRDVSGGDNYSYGSTLFGCTAAVGLARLRAAPLPAPSVHVTRYTQRSYVIASGRPVRRHGSVGGQLPTREAPCSRPLACESKPHLLRHPVGPLPKWLLDGEVQSPRRENDDRQIDETHDSPVELSAGVYGRDPASKEGGRIEKSTRRSSNAS